MTDMRGPSKGAEPDVRRVVRSWLGEDRHEDATRVLGVVLNGLDTAPQRATRQRTDVGRWTLRLLAVAALLTIGVGSAVLLDAPDDLPALGSNGWIAQGHGGDIYFLAPDQASRRVIGHDGDGVSEGCPAFSPDGRQLAYGRVAGEYTSYLVTEGFMAASPETYHDAALVIAEVADDGSVTDQLTVDLGDGLPPPCPVWAPTGDRIAFAVPQTSPRNPAQSAAGSEVWIVTVADGGITKLPDLLATDLEFSPDGTLLGMTSGTDALTYGRALADGRIYLYELASGATRTLEGTLGALSFTWSPDGGRIAYMTGELDPELRLVDLATEEQRVLDPNADTLHGIGPVWSPDGESILYQRLLGSTGEKHNVVLLWPDDLSADGTPREEVFTLFNRWADGSERQLYPYWVTWSPDGEYLLFSAWPDFGSSLLGVTSAVPGSAADILVDDTSDGPESTALVQWEPSMLIQTWGRLPADGGPS